MADAETGVRRETKVLWVQTNRLVGYSFKVSTPVCADKRRCAAHAKHVTGVISFRETRTHSTSIYYGKGRVCVPRVRCLGSVTQGPTYPEWLLRGNVAAKIAPRVREVPSGHKRHTSVRFCHISHHERGRVLRGAIVAVPASLYQGYDASCAPYWMHLNGECGGPRATSVQICRSDLLGTDVYSGPKEYA